MQNAPSDLMEATTFNDPALRVAVVLLPCFNEEGAIGAVIDRFRKVLPGASIYVYDNNSTDRTAEVAAGHGAIVRREQRQGKGHVMRRMFGDVEADVYVLADGDGTTTTLALRPCSFERCRKALTTSSTAPASRSPKVRTAPDTGSAIRCCRASSASPSVPHGRTCCPATKSCRAVS